MKIILAILLLASTAVADRIPTDYQKWNHPNNQKEMQFGGTIQNYPDTDGWHPINNDWVLNGDSMYVAWQSVLKATVGSTGTVMVTLEYGGNNYVITQTPKKLIWINTDTWNWTNVADDPTWGIPSADSNIVGWNNVFPGVNYKIQKSNGSVAHGIFFKPAFLDSAVTLYNRRADSSFIALGNVIEYTLSADIDYPDSAYGNIPRRVLKRIGSMVFKLHRQNLRVVGLEIPNVPITQRWIKAGGKIYCVEYVMMSTIKQVHETYPNATIWHNTEIYFAGSSTIVDATRLTARGGFTLRNYGAHSDLSVGDDFQPQGRFWHSLIRFNTLDDSMRNVGAATWDSARIGLTLDVAADANDSLVVTAHKITTVGWLEGEGTGVQDTCGAVWDSANATGYTDCAGSPLDWTVDGGDYSATRETAGSHADSVILTLDDWSLDDTVYFYISSATVSDTMGNKAGILLYPLQYIDDDTGNTWGFDSDDQTSRRPFLQVWYTAGAPPPAPEGKRRKTLIGGI